MTFFARPNLDDTQFKQLSGSTLTLEGRTIINTYSGLTLTGDYGQIPVVITGETDGYVMTYKSGQIVLAETTASGGSTIYNGASPTTCATGGIAVGTPIAGCEVTRILEMMLVPTLAPTCTAPYATLTLSPSTVIFEVGRQVAFTANGGYNQGTVSPVYCGGPSTRTGLPVSYNYTDTYGVTCIIASSSLSNSTALASHAILEGLNCVKLNVTYLGGQYPRKSDGSTDGMTCCPAGTTSPSVQVNTTGVYPYFWGSSASAPVINQTLINDACTAGNVCVVSSDSNILVSNYNVSGQYIWFAIPCASTTKTKWQGANSPSNCGTIPGDLFAAEVKYTINSPSSCWLSRCYKFYVSNYPTSVNYGMTFKNS